MKNPPVNGVVTESLFYIGFPDAAATGTIGSVLTIAALGEGSQRILPFAGAFCTATTLGAT
ncbi:hypothetical protein [Halomonas huangheensis]|uniref:hypothetical protein n=1 Tax=Halomonas huangheensis TaxID=1178482 RepID=UPI000400E775|nr:hypothetical protein [Halomonas huangheensis]